MKLQKWVKASGTVGLATLAGITSSIAIAGDSGWYGGANIGQSRAKIDEARITNGLLTGGVTTTSIDEDDRDTGYKIFGGYRLNRYFALEGGYFNLGEFGFTSTTSPPGSLTGKTKLQGLNFDVVGILPLSQRFSAFGRVGVNYAESKTNFSRTGAVSPPADPSPSSRDANYKVGLGLQYDFTQALGMRVEAERYRIDAAVGNKGDVDLISVGLVYRFGGKAPAPAPREVAYEPVVAAAPAPVPRKVTFSADSLFDFDKAIVKPAGKQALDTFAADLRSSSFDVITVTGHTDRIGTHSYNLELSARRAEAVKAYLVQAAGIPAGKISARGVDGSNPVTKPSDCVGNTPTPQLIACLQPDRRVEVEVTATQTPR